MNKDAPINLKEVTLHEVNENFEFFYGFEINTTFLDNVKKELQQGQLIVELDVVDFKTDTWDGEMRLIFKYAPTATEIVNRYVAWAYADEVQMLNHNTLRLRWD